MRYPLPGCFRKWPSKIRRDRTRVAGVIHHAAGINDSATGVGREEADAEIIRYIHVAGRIKGDAMRIEKRGPWLAVVA